MRPSARWLVPLTAAAVIAGGTAVSSAQAGNAPALPERTPQQLLQAIAGSDVTALSGTVVTRAELGLPSLSQLSGRSASSAGSDLPSLITRFASGENTLRVWADGPTRQRAQLLDPLDELDVVRDGSQVWTYAARRNEALHAALPARAGHERREDAVPPAGSGHVPLTPDQAARRVLAAVDPSTEVSVGEPELVANRPAYTLVLTPKTSQTLVDHVVIAVDAGKSVPVQVRVFARGHTQPALETGFTAIDFSRPGAQTFTFTPPQGATVRQLDPAQVAPDQAHPDASGTHRPRPTVIGAGWAAIVEVPASAMSSSTGGPASGGKDPSGGKDEAQDLRALTTAVDGGRAVSSALGSLLLTDDGRVLAGAVPVQALVDAARR